MKPHDWQTTVARPGRSYYACTRCTATEEWRLVDGKSQTWRRGPKECEENRNAN